MDYQTVSEQLKLNQICKSTQAANATASYFFMWLHGQSFDFNKTQVRTHRARLRQLGIDIAETCDLTKHSAVKVTEIREINVQELAIPEWYQRPAINHLKLVA